MLLAVDIGNSHIALGVFEGETLRLRSKISTLTARSADEYAAVMDELLRMGGVARQELSGCVLSSVVPEKTGLVEQAMHTLTGLSVLKVGPGIKTGFRIRIDDPSQLGGDLVADTLAALTEHGAPLIIIDAGTVTTISAVDSERTYLGCSILPGIHSSAAQLKEVTALLPSIALGEEEEGPLGRSSAESMRCGLLLGSSMQVDGFVQRCLELPKMAGAKVIATGGSARLVTARCRTEILYDGDLTLKGLRCLFEANPTGGKKRK